MEAGGSRPAAPIVTTGQRVVPRRLNELGYEFRQPDLETALRSATKRV
jgi:NAD dependent epimerase/dehydratase family enzyme